MSEEFTAAELVAIAGAVKEKQLNAAKAALADGFSETVALTIRINAQVQKGARQPGGPYEIPAVVDLGAAHVFAALRKLGIGKTRFANALAAVPTDVPFDEEFGAVVRAENEARAKLLPTIKGTSPARAGSVTSTVSIERINEPTKRGRKTA